MKFKIYKKGMILFTTAALALSISGCAKGEVANTTTISQPATTASEQPVAQDYSGTILNTINELEGLDDEYYLDSARASNALNYLNLQLGVSDVGYLDAQFDAINFVAASYKDDNQLDSFLSDIQDTKEDKEYFQNIIEVVNGMNDSGDYSEAIKIAKALMSENTDYMDSRSNVAISILYTTARFQATKNNAQFSEDFVAYNTYQSGLITSISGAQR